MSILHIPFAIAFWIHIIKNQKSKIKKAPSYLETLFGNL